MGKRDVLALLCILYELCQSWLASLLYWYHWKDIHVFCKSGTSTLSTVAVQGKWLHIYGGDWWREGSGRA